MSMIYDVFNNGKAKPGSALFAAPAFVYPVETFKDSFLGFFGDACAVVLYCEDDVFLGFVYVYLDAAAGVVVFDGIGEEV